MPGETASSAPIEPRRAIVTPRARREGLTAAVSLADLIEPIIARGMKGDVEIVGPPGSGKTTALAHLAAVLPNQANIELCEEHCSRLKNISIVTRRVRSVGKSLATFFLAEWTIDDCMEYLAATHRDRARSVLARLSDDPALERLQGLPHLLCRALDRMAEDETIEHVFDAARKYVLGLASKKAARKKIGGLSIRRLQYPQWLIMRDELPLDVSPELVCLLDQLPVQRIFAAETLVEGLEISKLSLARILPKYVQLIFNDMVTALRHRPKAIAVVNQVFLHANRESDSIAASLLLAVDPNWRICTGHPYQLREAKLSGAKWSGIDLQNVTLIEADLSRADLSNARLNRASAREANFSGADLGNASVTGIDADRAIFSNAILCGFDGAEGNFERANFTRANLQQAILTNARLNMADFSGANLRGANLNSAWLMVANLEGADFTNADLIRIACCDCDFRQAILHRTQMARASLLGCNLEGMEIPDAMFGMADFTGAYLTASRMPRGIFRRAKLCSAGLADIEWEHADLRDADFTDASFHMGSTRCGLVDSDLASEGTRTGFYTDDFTEQEFRAPEEIRKANLCNSDLRGAKVEGCDFYLVDLRNAKYAQDQADHFAKCGAILRSRVT